MPVHQERGNVAKGGKCATKIFIYFHFPSPCHAWRSNVPRGLSWLNLPDISSSGDLTRIKPELLKFLNASNTGSLPKMKRPLKIELPAAHSFIPFPRDINLK
jgi:hypothetical protein